MKNNITTTGEETRYFYYGSKTAISFIKLKHKYLSSYNCRFYFEFI